MRGFSISSTKFIQDEVLLSTIKTSPSYQELKKEREDMHVLLEASNKLGDENILSLSGNGVTLKEKDTVIPLARVKPNGVLTQVLREERREEEERLRRAQEMKFTVSTNIEDVLFKGGVRVKEKKLNDFLTMELGGRGVVDKNRSVLLKEFFKDPKKYIRDAGVLGEIQMTDAYARMEWTVREETDMEEDIKKLHYNHVSTLLGWLVAAPEVKEIVHRITESFLDAALEEARNSMRMSAAMKLEGLYESVYNARWSHLVEVPGGEGTGLEVREGEPPQSWTYKAVGRTLEKDDGVQQSGAASPRLMVLTSDKGWPYSWNMTQDSSEDFFVNCEVDRVWQIVIDDLTEWFSNFDLTLNSSPVRRVLIGTPGIGKSVAAGSYLLYQLLHYDAEKIQVVVHCFGGRDAYVSDKTTRAATRYGDEDMCISELRSLRGHGRNVYIIYDVAKEGTPPPRHFAPTSGWGMILVSSPNEGSCDEWETQVKASRIIMNCPDEMDVKAMCAWMKQGLDKDKQAGYWRMVEKQMEKVGPIPRYIFDAKIYIVRLGAVSGALLEIKPNDAEKYFSLGGSKLWYSEDPSHKLVKIVRARTDEGAEVILNAPICADIGFRTADCLAKEMATKDIFLLML
ncbi:putative retrotransposon hot spot protein (RHS) [Trypanosoma cruzi]|uniref:Putative retrotransposon hot spot protein (RHS) n=1 Tax=Trypanosoma cruzi TaxID=5693 RepID=A0A2V2X3N9_TRYCR|nr:putative retrotransposon hot spot protein (RHS) [Trypanosoma cruzi]